MNSKTEQNKSVVIRFNKECIEQGLDASFNELLADDVINHSAAPGMPNGKESFTYFLKGALHKAFSHLKVNILDQVAENDLVTTRKSITGVHTGELFGMAPTARKVEIKVIDIIRLKDGKYAEHWGQSNFSDVLAELRTN